MPRVFKMGPYLVYFWSGESEPQLLTKCKGLKLRADGARLKELLKVALTDQIADRAMFMKGIDYSYYYEEAVEK